MAYDRQASKRKNVSLSDLTETLLRCSLKKDPAIRISTRWGESKLPQPFINYAVLDAYATWKVYSTLLSLATPASITSNSPGGTPAMLFSPDGQKIASGIIALDQPNFLKDIKVTCTRSVFTVQTVHIPSYLHSPSLCPSKLPTAFSEFGTPPFSIVCYTRHLRADTGNLYEETNKILEADNMISEIIPQPLPPDLSTTDVLPSTDDIAETGLILNDVEVPDQHFKGSVYNLDAVACLQDLIQQVENFDASVFNTIHSRVCGDIFHLHHEFLIPVSHGLRRPFTWALSGAIFLPNADDKAAIDAVLKKNGEVYEKKILTHPSWILKRLRRYVPPPEILLPRVTAVIKTYGPLEDATTHQPLFSNKVWPIAKNILENIFHGYFSDPPGIQLYYLTGVDSHGLNLYRCCRGTNNVEGGVHQNLIRRYTSFNTSPRHAVNVLLDYVTTHNIQVCNSNNYCLYRLN
jgi:hypothetical protein